MPHGEFPLNQKLVVARMNDGLLRVGAGEGPDGVQIIPGSDHRELSTLCAPSSPQHQHEIVTSYRRISRQGNLVHVSFVIVSVGPAGSSGSHARNHESSIEIKGQSDLTQPAIRRAAPCPRGFTTLGQRVTSSNVAVQEHMVGESYLSGPLASSK
ncbi:MAG: hypothetical protein ACRDRJ_08910 [Streptosporangiaceae bacterium]